MKKTKLAYVDVVAKAPRDVRRQQMKHGTAGRPLRGVYVRRSVGKERKRFISVEQV